jgi:TRAP-type C4-dicarboxylate transport system permease small subunit
MIQTDSPKESHLAAFRRRLNYLFTIGGGVAAFFIVLIALIIIVQVIGRELGFQIHGADDFTSWSVAASIFFALAYTFKKGAHIQVTLITERLTGRVAKTAAIISLFVSAIAIGFLTISAGHLLYDNYQYGDLAPGLLSVPMWIPTISLLLGAILLFLAILDSFFAAIFGWNQLENLND